MLLLFALTPTIAIGAAYSYSTRTAAERSPLGIAIAVGAVVVMPYLWVEKGRIGREAGCRPLSIGDFMAVTLLGGLLTEYLFRVAWVDYLATGMTLIFAAREAIGSYHDRDG